MNFKRIVASIVAILLVIGFMPYQPIGHIHTHASEIVSEHDGQSRNFAPGDLNGDSNFAAEDLVTMKEVLLGVEEDADIINAVDCNGDYSSDLIDLVRLKKHIANDIGNAPFSYELDSNDNAVITAFDNSVSGAITIPAKIDGYTVTAIGDNLFKDNNNITSVLIPNTVNTIGDNSFAGCENLKGTALPNSINEIGDNAFTLCKNMSNIRLSENTLTIGEGAFSFCSSLIEINIPEKVTVLNNAAFQGCSSLVFVGLPENLKEIKTYTFYGCEKLESVSIPITVVEVGNNAFDSCESLLSVVIPYETAFGENVFSNCPQLVVKGYAGTGAIDAAVNSGANYELLECGHSDYVLLYAENPTCTESGYSGDKYCVECGKIEVKGAVIYPSGHITELRNVKAATCTVKGYTGDTVCTVCDEYLSNGRKTDATGHYASNIDYIDTESTCTAEGKYGIFTCEYCNKEVNNDAIPALGHYYDLVGKKYASCVEDGYTGDYVCSRVDCDYVIYGEVILKGSHNYILYNFREPTCTQDGYSGDRICCGCGDVKSYGTVTTKPHTPVTANYKAATCTENGYSGDSTCLECGTSLSSGEELSMLGHKSVLINYVAPTCTEKGHTGNQICSVCNVMVTVGKEIDELGHKLVLKNQKDCTASEDGYTGDWVCETCGETVTSGNVIPANHTHIMEISNKKEATCTETGYTGDSTCSVCGYFVKGSVEPVKSHVISTTVVDPKCTEGGYTIDECNNCDYERKYSNTEALGHNWDAEWTVAKKATCTEDGEQIKNCSRCEEKQKETIKSEGHKLGEPQNTTEPTCTTFGYTGDRVCSVCGETVEGEKIAKKDHNLGAWQTRCYHSGNDTSGDSLGDVLTGITGGTQEQLTANDYVENYKICSDCGYETTATINSGALMFDKDATNTATCTENGYIKYDCKYCDYSYTETQRKLGHNYSTVVTKPTCTEQGYTVYSCNRCDYEYTSDYLEPLGHDCTTTITNPTCTDGGYTLEECSNCDYENKYDVVSALSHDWDEEWTIEKKATCTEEGEQYKNCSRCDEKLTEVIDALGHSFEDWQIRCFHRGSVGGDIDDGLGDDMSDGMLDGFDDEESTGEITEEYAEEYSICSTCQYEETHRLATETEMYTENVITPVSCTENGEICYNCNYCEYSYTETRYAYGHSYNFEIFDPTCTEYGYTYHYCSNCSDSYASDYVDPIGHCWSPDGYCYTCNTPCDHIPDEAGGLCANCGKMPCPFCQNFEHYAYTYEECPIMSGGVPGGLWCDDCGTFTDHMTGEPICPMMSGTMMCDLCGNYGHDASSCPTMMG